MTRDIAPNLETLGGRLRHARTLAGVSARELDRATGGGVLCSQVERAPGLALQVDVVLRYADALGLDLNWLVRGVGPTPAQWYVRNCLAEYRARRGDADPAKAV